MDREQHVRMYADKITAIAEEGPNTFQGWFNGTKSASEARVSGFWDFANDIASLEVRQYLWPTHDKTALEIGYGGGRLLNAAGHFFGNVIGIDIHDEVGEARLGISGILGALHKGDGETLKGIPDQTVDFVYSYITLHHLHSGQAFQSYIRETYRVLKPGGLAHLYYVPCDTQGYKVAKDYKPNQQSLYVNRDTAVTYAQTSGFDLIKEHISHRFEHGEIKQGFQRSMLLKKAISHGPRGGG